MNEILRNISLLNLDKFPKGTDLPFLHRVLPSCTAVPTQLMLKYLGDFYHI